MTDRVAVIAIGGNSLIKDADHQSPADQYATVNETTDQIARMIGAGWKIIIGHGNGPQVGFLLRQSEMGSEVVPEIPLPVAVAHTQGAIGYMIQQNLYNDLRRLGIPKNVTTVLTQVEVDADDPAFEAPSKPIGSFLDKVTADAYTKDGWKVVEDAGRGWRRVVASPRPIRIVEMDQIKALVAADAAVITVGGGGIPVVANQAGQLADIAAVIDKDYAASRLAQALHADLFAVCTGVEKVALHFGKPEEEWLDTIPLSRARQLLAEGVHFAAGSMAPKVEAVIDYLEAGGKRAIITNPDNLERACQGETGTHFVQDEP